MARWLKGQRPMRSFIILPLQENGSAYGFVWSGCSRAVAVSVGPAVLKQLRALRTHVTTVKTLEAQARSEDASREGA